MDEKQLIEQYKIQGKENAINYVKEKYGLDVNLLKVLLNFSVVKNIIMKDKN